MRDFYSNLPLLDLEDQSWRSRFLLASEARGPTERRRLAEAAMRGSLIRVGRGTYLIPPVSTLAGDRYRDRVLGYSLANPRAVFTHRSAAAIWSLPRVGRWPDELEVLGVLASGGRSAGTVRRRMSAIAPETEVIGGIEVTSLGRTAVDLARVDSVASAVGSVDAALRGYRTADGAILRASRDDMIRMLEEAAGGRGVAGARWVVDFADGRSESNGESLSRVQIARIGFAAPELQHEFRDEEGFIYPDFLWEEYGVAGEFDGFSKYLRHQPETPDGVANALLAEKRREDRLRRLVRTVVRWDWSVARDRNALRALLYAAGVR